MTRRQLVEEAERGTEQSAIRFEHIVLNDFSSRRYIQGSQRCCIGMHACDGRVALLGRMLGGRSSPEEVLLPNNEARGSIEISILSFHHLRTTYHQT